MFTHQLAFAGPLSRTTRNTYKRHAINLSTVLIIRIRRPEDRITV